LLGARLGVGLRQAGNELRHHDVFQRRKLRQQVMELVDEADLRAPDRRGRCRQAGNSAQATNQHVTLVGIFQQSGQVQQRRLAGARMGDQRHRFPGGSVKSATVENRDLVFALHKWRPQPGQAGERVRACACDHS
jgi:hypothetical protein